MTSEEPKASSGSALVGREIGGRFVLRDVIGEGGTGWVYRADQTALARKVAIKILYPELAADQELARRFRQEALAASRLNHPNTISVIDYGTTPDGLLYLVMEHLRGRTLTQLVYQEGTVPLARAVDLVGQILAALEEAHSEGVVHADLKSDNVMVETLRDGRDVVKVLDFGLARIAEARGFPPEPERGSRTTGSRMVCGTPEYMAPEVVCGEQPTPASDLYAAGIVLYELICGVTPFHGGRPYEIAARHVQEQPMAVTTRRPDLMLDRGLDELLGHALAKDPQTRFTDAREFRLALSSLVSSEEWESGVSGRASARRTQQYQPIRPARTTDPFGVETRALPAVWVGRQRELQVLERFLRGADPGVLWVGGPTGMGKTAACRAAWVAAARADARGSAPKPKNGVRYVLVGPDPSGTARPWFPIRAALALLSGGAAGLRESGAAGGLDLTEQRLVATVLDDATGATGMDPTSRSGGSAPAPEIGQALGRAIALAAEWAGGASLVFDDVHQYDRPSRELLERLAEEKLDSLRLVLIAEKPPVTDGNELLLGPLSTEETQGLATQLGCSAVLDAVMERAGGSPAAVHQLARWYLDGNSLDGAPEATADLIAARVSKLPREARCALQAIAAFGMRALIVHLAEVLETDAMPALRLLEERGFVVARGDDVIFMQELEREVVYDATPADVRRQLHADALRVLEKGGESPAVLGLHADASGDSAGAVPLYLSASDAALRAQDPHGAVGMAQRALAAARREMWGAKSEGAQARFVETSIRLADVLISVGDLSLARGVLDEAAALLAGAPRGLGAELARAVARVALAAGDAPAAIRQLRAAVGAAITSGDLSRTAVLYAELGSALARTGEVGEGIEELEQGVDLCTLGDGPGGSSGPPELWRLVLELARLFQKSGLVRKSHKLAQDALRHADRAGATPGRRQANLLLAELSEALGDMAAANAHRKAAGS